MNSKRRALTMLLSICFLFSPLLRAQEDETNDSDLKKMLKEAEEMQKEAEGMQKTNPPAPGKKKTLAELQAEAKAEAARQEQEEKEEKAKLQAALQKQLKAPGPVALPNWTPATPQFHQTASPTKKIVDDEVRIVMTGTSTLTPDELGEVWVAAIADRKINHILNTNTSNGDKSITLFLDTREGPREKLRMHASRPQKAKITEVEIASPLPKPGEDSED